MTRDELRRAIVEPARSAGVAFEDGLVDLLLRDAAPSSTGPEGVAHDAGGLPLIEYALLATWARRRHGLRSVEAYRKTGGIRAAVSHQHRKRLQPPDHPAPAGGAAGVPARSAGRASGA
nr:hypothetical protein [Catenulispora acidiphila]